MVVPGFRCFIEGITITQSSYGVFQAVPPSFATTVPDFGITSNPLNGEVNLKFMVFATTGSVARMTRWAFGIADRILESAQAGSTTPVTLRNLSIVSTATSAALFSQCWPHSIRTAVRGRGAAPRSRAAPAAHRPPRPGCSPRDGDERRILARQRHHVGGQRHLRRVELAVAQHAKEGILDRLREEHQVDAVGPHQAGGQRRYAIVVPAGEREAKLAHRWRLVYQPAKFGLAPGRFRP